MRIRQSAVYFVLLAAAFVWFTQRGSSLFSESPEPAENPYRADGRYDGPPLPSKPRLNLILLIVDTLRADCVGGSKGTRGDTPLLSALAREGARCTQVTTAAPATYPSITSLLTGLEPDEHRVDHTPDPPRLPAGITTFAEALSHGHGYDTAAFMEVRLSNEANGPLQGFTTSRAFGPLHAWRPSIERWNRSREREDPFFLLLHTYEAHDPYGKANHPWPERRATRADAVRTPALDRVSEAELVERFLTDRGVRLTWMKQTAGQVTSRYFHYCGRGYAAAPDPALAKRLEIEYRTGVRWVDGEVAESVAHLRSLGLLENTLLVITSDHGEAFGEHAILNHGRALYEELVHVPLVALGPAPFQGGREISTSFGLVDVLPTFFEMAGLPQLGGISGRSMLGEITSNAAGRAVLSLDTISSHKLGRFANVKLASARTATESYILRFDVPSGEIREELYDRSADPVERHDLAAATGRIGEIPVSAALAEGIERARDRVWTADQSSQAHLRIGYGGGGDRAPTPRPAPARTR